MSIVPCFPATDTMQPATSSTRCQDFPANIFEPCQKEKDLPPLRCFYQGVLSQQRGGRGDKCNEWEKLTVSLTICIQKHTPMKIAANVIKCFEKNIGEWKWTYTLSLDLHNKAWFSFKNKKTGEQKRGKKSASNIWRTIPSDGQREPPVF